MTNANSTADTYPVATTSVVRYDASAQGRLRLTGRDRADLIHRLSTNDIAALTPGMGTRTVLTNHNARIVDLLTVYSLPEHLLVTTSVGQGSAITQLLQKNIFFQDKVVIENITDTTVAWQLYGPQAAQLLTDVTSVEPGDWAVHHVQAVQIKSKQAWLARLPALPLGTASYAVFAERGDWDSIASVFDHVPQLDQVTFDMLRVEAGYPAWGSELSLEYIPLETQLRDAVSFSKGCYVGQEIIARMDSRQRLAKQLMALRLHAPVTPGTKLLADGKEQGELTSVAQSPRLGLIGLGYIRTAHATPGTRLTTAEGVAVEVQELPTHG